VPKPSPAVHRTIVVVDVAGFTDGTRTMIDQFAVHEGMYVVLAEAFSEAGIDWAACTIEDRGDGAMILIPAVIPKSGLVNRLPGALTAALRRYNAVHTVQAKFQLRVVLHSGEVRQNTHGVVSQAVNLAFRILDAEEAKLALRRSASPLALIASDPFFQEVVRNDPAAEPDSYNRIAVSVKGTTANAWLRLFAGTVTPAQTKGVPAVWGNVPMRNPIFTGREELLDQLSHRLATGGPTVILAAALHGMGGIGKTQIAVEYIYRRLQHYDIVWWIQAAQAAQIRTNLTQLAQQLRLPGAAEANTAVPAALDALRLGQPYRRWLLVFDAADSPDVLRPFIPANGPGEVLITSRNPNWFGIAHPLEVAVFNRGESVEFLRRRGLDVSTGEAEQLAEKLGDLPLAVEQAAAWQVETGMPVHEYLRLFDEKVAEILDTAEPADYAVSVGAAWNLSFDELQTRNAAAYQILEICSFFAPEPIYRSMFGGFHGVSISPALDSALRDPVQLSRAIRDINRFGLAKVDHRGGTLVVHRLVQLLLRIRIAAQRRQTVRHTAHLLLANHDPSGPAVSGNWPRYREVLPHVAASSLIECADPWARQLVMNLTQFLYYWGDHEEAAELARQALDEWSARSGETDPYSLRAAAYLGLYLWSLGRFTEAALLNQRTLDLHSQISGENSRETIISQLLVALGIKSRGDFISARDIDEEVYRKARGLFGDDDPITLQTAHDLASTVRLCGDYQRALKLDEHTYLRRTEVLGYDNVDTLSSLTAMIIDRRELGDYRHARVEQEKIAQRVQAIVGDDRADTLWRLADLSVARRKDGDHAGALELSAKVLKLYRRRYGGNHPNAVVCAVGHSIDLRHAHEFDAARELGERTLHQCRDILGADHPHTLSAAVNLAVTLRMIGECDQAIGYNRRSLERFQTGLGADHPHAVACAIDLASDLATSGEASSALALGQDALHRARRTLGADHPTTLAASLNVAVDLRAVHRVVEADALRADALRRYHRVLGADHPATADAQANVRANCDIDPLPM
jgi:tetratricopeptide (TPR) repeat protein